jgi:hypothetical protein
MNPDIKHCISALQLASFLFQCCITWFQDMDDTMCKNCQHDLDRIEWQCYQLTNSIYGQFYAKIS